MEGIKSNPKKVQAILDIQRPPTNTKVIHRGLRHISLTQHAESKLCKPLHIPDLYFTDTADAFASTVEEIDFRLAPELMEVEQQLELNTENSMKRNGNAFLVQIQFGF
eukprot:scaffold1618_cov269-Chaetoceros_neogracile.AAC.3